MHVDSKEPRWKPSVATVFSPTVKAISFAHLLAHPVIASLALSLAPAFVYAQKADPPKRDSEVRKAIIPDDLLGDEHLREEFGVNQFTTPSIERIFELLGTLGTLPYDKLHRPIPDKIPSDRIAVSLGLGALIADGFLVVQCEKIEHMEPIGRALLKHAKVLGAGMRVNRHSQSLLEHSVKGDWKVLREELTKTQFDVEAEMLQLRDVDIAHLVSLGGWLRAFEISTRAAMLNYDPEKTRNLARRDIAEYYLMSLETLHPAAQQQPIVQKLRKGLEELMPLVDVPEGKELTLEEVKPLAAKAAELAKNSGGE